MRVYFAAQLFPEGGTMEAPYDRIDVLWVKPHASGRGYIVFVKCYAKGHYQGGAPDTSPAVTHTESFDVKTIFARFFIERGRFAGYMFGRDEIEKWAKEQPAGAFDVPAFVEHMMEELGRMQPR